MTNTGHSLCMTSPMGPQRPIIQKKQSIVGDAGEAECTHTSGHCEAVCTTPRCSSRISCQGDISISRRRLQTFAHSTWLRAAGCESQGRGALCRPSPDRRRGWAEDNGSRSQHPSLLSPSPSKGKRCNRLELWGLESL